MKDNRPVILERFVVKASQVLSGKWHYIAAGSNANFMTVCGQFVPPSPPEKSLIKEGNRVLHNEVCKNCAKIIDGHCETGRRVRLAQPREGLGDAM